MEKLHDHQGTSYGMTHIEAKSINIWLRYDPKCNLSFCKECGHEVGLHYGSYLSQMLTDFESIWLILKLTVSYEYNGCDIRMSSGSSGRITIRSISEGEHHEDGGRGERGSGFPKFRPVSAKQAVGWVMLLSDFNFKHNHNKTMK